MHKKIVSLSIVLFLLLFPSAFCQKAFFSVQHNNVAKITKVDLLSLIQNINRYDDKWIETTEMLQGYLKCLQSYQKKM